MKGCSFGADSFVEPIVEATVEEAARESERASLLEVEGRVSLPPFLMEKARPEGAVVFLLTSMSVPPTMVKFSVSGITPLVAPMVTTPPRTCPRHPRENSGGPLFTYKGVWLGGSYGACCAVGSR